MIITVSPEGQIRMIYTDELCGLLEEGTATIERASNVEPRGTQWEADMGPSGSAVVLGPFKTRTEALAAEVRWLQEHVL